MHYGEIKNCDIANGEGVRISLFVSGCTNHCENCFQPQTWDFNYGTPFTKETEDELLRLLAPDYINGLTLLGGEPFVGIFHSVTAPAGSARGSGYERDKTHSRHTGRACCDTPAARGRARSV